MSLPTRSLPTRSLPTRSRLTRTLLASGTAAVLALTGAATGPVAAAPVAERAPSSHLDLPDGFQPEGIATGPNAKAYLGSRADGDIYRLNLRTGRGRVISQGPGTPSLGLKLDDRGRLFVAGGTGGDARVVDARSGRVLRSYRLVRSGDTFINDVVLTKRAAWFTDSENAQLFKVPLGRDGRLPKRRDVRRVALGGQWVQSEGLNANGISTTPDGKALIVVNSGSGELFRVNRRTGHARLVALRGGDVTNGDGLLREGRTLYAVQNQLNRIAVIHLARTGRSGRVDHLVTTPDFDIPTTVARSGGGLYLPNARFSTPPTPDTEYWVTRVAVPRG